MASNATEIVIPTADGEMPALLWGPEGAAWPGTDTPSDPRPALVVFQEIFGVSDYIQQRCADLADLGYAVLAPEFYWRLPARRVDEDAPDLLEQGMALMSQLDWDAAVRDGVAAVQHLRTMPGVSGVGLVGFCLGGGLAYATAAQAPVPPEALVSYYGSALPQLVAAGVRVSVPSLHHFGTADAYIPVETAEDIRAWVTGVDAEVQFQWHEGAGHAFDNPHPAFCHAEASRAAWQQTVDFLARTLPAG